MRNERQFCIMSEKEGTSVRNELMKSRTFNQSLDMMYMTNNGAISKRRIKVIQIGEDSFLGYCYLRKAKRTFRIDNILALVPVILKEGMVI